MAMGINTVYFFAIFIPLLITPMLLPAVVLMARRKNLTDRPNTRKKQSSPVAVMGGTVMMLVLCITCSIVNLFYSLPSQFSLFCMMVILYIFGLIDDTIGLSWKVKLVIQASCVLLFYFSGTYGVHSFDGLFGLYELPFGVSIVVTIFVGLLIINAVNFADGIDGLASGLGVMISVVMVYWNFLHCFVPQTIVALSMIGIMAMFFLFNVFSKRYKMYMGDSGSMVLGLFVYISACPDASNVLSGDFLVDAYFVSFITALLSAMVFDLIRVAITRLMAHKSPFLPDRNHLHHILVDLGLSHLLATTVIIILNLIVILIWYVTASSGMNPNLQFFLTVAAAILFIWMPYYIIVYLKNKHLRVYARLSIMCNNLRQWGAPASRLVTRIIDGPRSSNLYQ